MISNKQFLVELDQLVITNIKDPHLSVSKLCYIIKISRATMYRKIKHLYKCSPKEYLENARLNIAKKKIDSDDCKIKVLAFEVGYNDPKWFSKKFKEKFMITPTEYKNKNYPIERYTNFKINIIRMVD